MSVTAINGEVLICGEVDGTRVKGSVITAKVVPGGSLFDRRVPIFYLQPVCNHCVYSPGCGLAKADWKFTATVKTAYVAGYPHQLVLQSLTRVTGPTPTYFAQWFAGGWIEHGTGAAWQRRAILQSSSVVSGELTLTLSRDPSPVPAVGQTITLYPGCDGRIETCRPYNSGTNPEGKFANQLNYGGHPYMPAGNPSLIKLSGTGGGGKK